MIELRSDTKTMPSPAMREAMAQATVGDEQAREDPTVIALEEAAAVFVGQEEAVYLPTATMANAIALVLLGERGSVLLAEESAHVLVYELGGAAMFAGLLSHPLPGSAGRLTAEQIRSSVGASDPLHIPRASILAIENSHNSAGGTVWPYEELEQVVAVARELDLRVHLDGARLANAAIAIGRSAAEIGALFDTVTLCLSKGLGCPLGAILAGSRSLMARARVEKHRFGGAMRQAGIVAAAGLYALEHNVERLAEDHARARRLAEGWKAAGLAVDLARVQTNFVQIDTAECGLDTPRALARLAAEGVLLSATVRPGVIRALTHLDVDDADIDQAIEIVPRALRAPEPDGEHPPAGA
ncbi:MAG TPA: GntG family PLP-dependent aldolase [Solirubrobacteraceae bacterium]|nr:GntG family PLP-dependent aldolase [Solirubrobacteraceae bacterium]